MNNKLSTHFLVLVPHRDTRLKLQKYSEKLVKSGLKNVYNFPCVAPIAVLSRPLTALELKQIASSLRKFIGMNKMITKEVSTAEFPLNTEKLTITGPLLIPDFSHFFTQKNKDQKTFKKLFSPILIGTFLLPENKKQQFEGNPALEESVFGAASITNMHWKTIKTNNVISYKWEIEKLQWLPKAKKNNFL